MKSAGYCPADIFGSFLLVLSSCVSCAAFAADVEQWGVWETSLGGPRQGNPYLEVQLSAVFRRGEKHIQVPGFYDGEGVYKIRFSPPAPGEWRYETRSNRGGRFQNPEPAGGCY